MEFKIIFSFAFFIVLMLVFGIYSVGSYQSNQPDLNDRYILMLDSINKKLEISNQEIRAKIERNDSVLQELEIQNAKLRKALNMPAK